MPRLILAAVSPDNTPHGYNWTFAFPMLLFIIIAAVLYLRVIGRPHRRVPARRITIPAGTGVPGADTARSASIAGGLSTAPGGGTTESHLEGAGAHLTASLAAEPATTDPATTDPATTDPAADDESAAGEPPTDGEATE